jgi:hypothetical protein
MKKLLLATLTLTSLVTTHLASASPLGDEMRAEITAEKLKYKDFLGMTTPVEDDVALDGWVTDQATFNYKMPCDADKIKAVAIIVKDLCIVNDSRHPAFRHDNSNTKTFKFRKYF